MQVTKLDIESEDIVADNIEKLKQLFPEIVTEDKIDFDKLREVLGEEINDDDETYEFTWNGKHDAIRDFQKKNTRTLRPYPSESKNWDTTKNLYIEGNNFHVLKILQKSYQGKIKMMYIDPPYNTGNDSFIYKDNFQDTTEEYVQKEEKEGKFQSNPNTSAKFHTNWLNMMYKRLLLARTLLKEDGVIFISIDDNELFNLKKICDEIFGEKNCILTTIINRPSEIGTEFSILKHEYLLIYCKNKESVKLSGNTKYTISRGTVGNENQTTPIIEFPAGLRCENIDDGVYKSTRQIKDSKENIKNLDEIVIENGILKKPVRLQARWRSSNDMRNFFKNDCKPTKAKINGIIEEIWFKSDRFMPQIKKKVTQKIPSIYLDNKRGSKDIEKLFDKKLFDFPKSVNFVKDFIALFSEENDIILDFFSGSGTTSEAVFNLNIETNKNNQFILVQCYEKTKNDSVAFKEGYKNICEIGKERIRRAGDLLLEENPNADIDVGFKVFKVDSSNFKEWNPTDSPLEEYIDDSVINIKSDRSELDLVYEIMLKYGIELTAHMEEVKKSKYNFYSVGYGALIICLNDEVNEDVTEDIINIINENVEILDKKGSKKNRVVFKDNSFLNDSVKTNIIQILENKNIEDFITY